MTDLPDAALPGPRPTAAPGAPAPPVPSEALDAFIASRRGRRDGFVWGLGIVGGLFWLYVAGVLLTLWHVNRGPVGDPTSFWNALGTAVAGVVFHATYLARRRWSRWLLFLPVLASGVSLVAYLLGPHFRFDWDLVGLVLGEVGLLLVPIAAWRSPLNRLVFDLEVPRETLEAAYRDYQENRTALLALALAIPAAVVPFACIPAAPTVLTAWRRSRQPGVKGGRAARGALWLLGLGALVTVGVLLLRLRRVLPGT